MPGPFTTLLPENQNEVYAATTLLMGVYLVVGYGVRRYRTGNWIPQKSSVGMVFDAATFAGSVLVLVALFYPKVLTALGDTKPYLILAGFFGLVYSFHALFADAAE